MNYIFYHHFKEFILIYLDNKVLYLKNIKEYIKHLIKF